ncbi:DUF1573 domain-containing protein [Microbacter margulisiae]|uniref:DUF1573 domain-containing protein n=1 Tax=Microbacter margulisiae TaxID=1350067 RepID=A0A7W5DNT9_9PORP|nr:DUF1573 domain-containing protein [Microbacter margulisiae]MBB3186181.1 hypothetical protein [Microbacter margulisiae]
MKKLSLLAFSVLISLICFAQERGKPVPVFSEQSFNFGRIPEEAGKVTHEFMFTNQGDGPLVIQQVIASCGCTTPVWPKEPIPPGGHASIRVTYSTIDRPGMFDKTITIYNNSNKNPVSLHITGEVIQKPVSIEQAYPQVMGPLRMKSRFISFGNMTTQGTKTEQILILNVSKAPVEVSLEKLPPYLKGIVVPSVMQPNSEAAVIFSLNSAMLHDWGIHSDEIPLIVNHDKAASHDNILTLTVNRLEDFTHLTPAERKNAPAISIIPGEVRLQDVKQNVMKRGSFIVKNSGASPLLLLKAFSDCDCIKTFLPKHAIAPQKEETVRFELTPGITLGDRFETLNIITNAPSAPSKQVHISWETVK